MKWTDKQRDAIETRQKNMLVSAAAGSGKTAVLVERIKQLVIVDGVAIDEILVVTFTKAAASEMKEKIVRALQKEIENQHKDVVFLKKQLEKIYVAQISTFHSFAMDIIKNYFHVINIPPALKICDETETALMKKDAMDQCFAVFFEEADMEFREFIRAYGTAKGEEVLKDSIMELYERIQAMPGTTDWLEDKIEFLNISDQEFYSSQLMEQVLISIRKKLEEAVDGFAKAGEVLGQESLEKLYKKNQDDLNRLKEIAGLLEFDQMVEALGAYKANQMRSTKEEKDGYEQVKGLVSALRDKGKKALKDVKEKYLVDSLSVQVDLMNKTYIYGQSILKILKSFRGIYQNKKLEKNLMDFNDIEHYAIEILKNPEVAREYREKFRYIFIDEYQDSNYLQEEIIGAIAREDNLFMVGDIKQSIYRFRLAEPDIFLSKYEKFTQETEVNKKIDLNENFRSKQLIIEGINSIFSRLMTNYGDEAALHSGSINQQDINYPVELHIVDGSVEGSMVDNAMGDDAPMDVQANYQEEMYSDIYDRGLDLDLSEDDEDRSKAIESRLVEWKNMELEALATVKIIKESVGKPFFDSKNNQVRPLEKKDIVILFRATKSSAEIFYNVLSDNDIPTFVDDNSGYFDTMEVRLFLDLLRVIDNRRQDVSLLAILRSPVFDFTIDELIKIRLAHKKVSYIEAFECYGNNLQKNEESNIDRELYKKIQDTLAKLDRWKQESIYTPIEDFVWTLMNESGIYSYVGAMTLGSRRQGNLRAFVDKTLAFAQGGNNTIFSLLRYIEIIGNRKIETGQVSLLSENDDLIRIMTIHKSKGLEFPMVLVCGLGKRFRAEYSKKTGSLHKDIGFAMTYVDRENSWYKKTLLEYLIIEKHKEESRAEELRILYVAMTRAMDRLVLVGAVDEYDSFIKKFQEESLGESSYLNLIYPILNKDFIDIHLHNRKSLGEYNQKGNKEKINIQQAMEEYEKKRNFKLKEEISRVLEYKYPNSKELSIKSKFTVSELNGEVLQQQQLNRPKFLQGEKKISGVEIGSIIHKIMEHLDFEEILLKINIATDRANEYVEEVVNSLVDRKLLVREEVALVKTSKVINFFQSDVGRRAAQAKKLYKERPFNMLVEHEGTEVIVQGIIDCYFQEGEELVLIDYKSNTIDGDIKEKYKTQMKLYGEALTKATRRNIKEAYLYSFSQDEFISVDI